jgi:hypothetical protein
MSLSAQMLPRKGELILSVEWGGGLRLAGVFLCQAVFADRDACVNMMTDTISPGKCTQGKVSLPLDAFTPEQNLCITPDQAAKYAGVPVPVAVLPVSSPALHSCCAAQGSSC